MTIDFAILDLGDIEADVQEMARECAGDGIELARRAANLIDLRAAGVPVDDARYLEAVEDGRVLAALIIQRTEIRIRARWAGLAADLVPAVARLVLAVALSAV